MKIQPYTTVHAAKSLSWLLSLLLIGLAVAAQATDQADPVSVLRQVMKAENASLDKLKADIDTLKEKRERRFPQASPVKPSQSDLEQARLKLESVQVDNQSVQLDQTSTLHQIDKLQASIIDLQHQISGLGNAEDETSRSLKEGLSRRLRQQQSLLSLQRQYLTQLNTRYTLLQQKIKLSRQWLDSLQQALQKQKEAQRQENLADLERKLQLEIQQKQAEVNRLQLQLEKIDASNPGAQSLQEELMRKIQALNERINLINGQLKLAANKAEVEVIDLGLLDKTPPATLKEWLNKIDSLRQRVEPAIELTEGKLKVLNQQLQLLEKRHSMQEVQRKDYQHEHDQLSRLIADYQTQARSLRQLSQVIKQKTDAIEKAYQWNLNRSLTTRQSLPRDPAVWRSIAIEAGRFPSILIQITGATGRDLASGWQNAALDARAGFAGMLLLLILTTLGLSRLPRPEARPLADEQTFSMKTKEVVFALLRGSRPVLLFGGALLAAGWFFGVDDQRFRLLLLLVLIGLVLQWIAKLSYWLFVSPLVPPAQRQPRIHHTLLWVISGFAIFTLLVGMGHFGFLSEAMRALVDRLFMLLLLPLVYLSLRLRNLLILGLRAEWKTAFWPRLIARLSFAIPLTILTAAIVGLAGYINLAWFVAWQLALFLGILMGWLVLRHLLRDAMNHWRQRAGLHQERVAFWIQGVINPLQHLLEIGLFLLMVWALALTFSWSTGTDLSGLLITQLGNTLFTIGRHAVTPLHLIGAAFLAFSVFYLGIWSRRLTYDLLYQQINDRGLRNSLSVFTQYAIIVIGLLLALNLLGIDLTSLTVFAGALGVGIGFGLQNIANNFISGLILLAERPVRTEDWVTTGEHQGRIKHIGMRSLTMTTWDNQDVIIPNAQLITNPVINWTLSDSLVRTVFNVGVRYQDDPHRAKQVIEEAVSMQPAVSLERPPRILLTEFGDSSVNFRVEFFAEVDRQSSRLKIKSEVMFAIWDALKEADIGIPFPQRDIYIKELPGSAESAGESAREAATRGDGMP